MTLNGVIEMHVHASPDTRERAVDDWGLVTSAEEAGVRAVVIKNHFFPTMCRAEDVQRASDKVRVFGGIALNYPVGGLNPKAVAKAIDFGAKVVWLPTHDAANHYRHAGKSGGLEIKPGNLEYQALEEIVRIVVERGVVLATGHLSPLESILTAELYVRHGGKKLVITHPELRCVDMSIENQRQLRDAGAYFERVYAQPLMPGNYILNLEQNYGAMEALGYESTVISTDGGQVENPFWTTSLQRYVDFLEQKGVPQCALDRMTKENPAYLLGLNY